MGSARGVLRGDREQDAPLLEQHAVGEEQAVARIVDVRRLGGRAVELDHLEAVPFEEGLDARRAHVVAAEVEALEAAADALDRGLERGRRQLAAVEEDRAAAVVADLDQLELFALREHVPQVVFVLVEIETRHAYGALVLEDQAFERAHAVAADLREALARDREDPAARLARQAVVEDAEFLAGD